MAWAAVVVAVESSLRPEYSLESVEDSSAPVKSPS
jgi:hypothetical protein